MLVLLLSIAAPAWPQDSSIPGEHAQSSSTEASGDSRPENAYVLNNEDERMLTPPPVSSQTYPMMLTSEERSNYLRGGVSFTSAYIDNALGAVNGHPISDVSYSVAPILSLDKTTPREHYLLTYAPGFTFYRRTSEMNSADHNASIEFEYRLTPHVTFSAKDNFQKSSNVFNQPQDMGAGGVVPQGGQGPNFSVITPFADRLTNFGNAGLNYQYGLNDMIGAGGTFTNLQYPHPEQVRGLFDSSSQAGLAFYSRRIARKQYVGLTYQYQRLLSYPTQGVSETQTHAALAFYTFSPLSRLSISFYGGPQYSDTVQPSPLPQVRSWNPAASASLGWQGRLTSFALNYEHVIAGGGGLMGAVRLDGASMSARQQITRSMRATVTAEYAQNGILANPLPGTSYGHSVSGTASLQQQFGQHLELQLGYGRIHQSYSNIEVISATPDTNREFISISYHFSKPIGK